MDKKGFMDQLRAGLYFLPQDEQKDILDEFEQHFDAGADQGKTEQELAQQLGDPRRICEAYRQNAKAEAGGSGQGAATETGGSGQSTATGQAGERTRYTSVFGFSRDVSIHERYRLTDVKDIVVESVDSDVRFLPGGDDEVRVDIEGTSASDISVTLRNGRLRIKQEFRLFRLLHWGKDLDIVITLPAAFYGTMKVGTIAGTVTLPGFKGYALKLQSTSGNFTLGELTANEIDLHTVSGDFRIGDLTAETIDIHTTSGDMRVGSITCNTINMESVSGSFKQKADAYSQARQFNFKSVSGDVELVASDHWEQMQFSTVSGDIKLQLPGDGALFEVQLTSVSGKVRSAFGNDNRSSRLIKAKTISGDLIIKRA